MKEADETDRESGYVVLPDEIEGKTISWHYAKDMRSVGIFVLGIVAAALMLVLENRMKSRKEGTPTSAGNGLSGIYQYIYIVSGSRNACTKSVVSDCIGLSAAGKYEMCV